MLFNLASCDPQRVEWMSVAIDDWYRDVMGDFEQALDAQFAE